MAYRYSMTKNKGGSAKYGPCEVCKKAVTGNMYHQSEKRSYLRPDDTVGWTSHKCHDLFGHKKCLEKKRKPTNGD